MHHILISISHMRCFLSNTRGIMAHATLMGFARSINPRKLILILMGHPHKICITSLLWCFKITRIPKEYAIIQMHPN